MQAFVLNSYDGPEGLELTTVPDPSRVHDEVLVEVGAIGVNFPDLLTTRGGFAGPDAPPFVPGRELAGIVREAAADAPWRPGDRVAAYVDSGAYAELVSVPSSRLVGLPAAFDLGTGAAMVINYHTSAFALLTRGRLAAGETVLVIGAGGGIGTAAVQVARASSARVVAGVMDRAQVSTAKEAGADEVEVLAPRFSARIRELCPGGVDVVLDPVGGDVFGEAVRSLTPGGRLVSLGFASGEVPEVRLPGVLARNLEILGVAWGTPLRRPGPTFAQTGELLSRWFEEGWVSPVIGRRDRLDDLPAALAALEQGAVRGKAVVELG